MAETWYGRLWGSNPTSGTYGAITRSTEPAWRSMRMEPPARDSMSGIYYYLTTSGVNFYSTPWDTTPVEPIDPDMRLPEGL